jgi:hypothetical protein
VTGDDLRHALAAVCASDGRARELTTQLRELQAREVVATDAEAAALTALDAVRALEILGEASPDAVTGARAAYDTAAETVRALDKAIALVQQRIGAHAAEHEILEQQVSSIMSELASPHVEALRAAVMEHAQNLGVSLRLLYRLDDTARRGTGFRTGSSAHDFAGKPGEILAAHGMRCDGHSVYPMLRDRIDSMTPAQLIAFVDSHTTT